MNAPTRPVLRWHGGKWRLAPWILAHFPPHRIYVEPFGGAASVLLRKERSYAEVYNDLDEEVVNLFRVLRDEAQASRLIELLRLTPFAREEFQDSYQLEAEPIERARLLIVRTMMGYGTSSRRKNRTGFRGRVYDYGQTGSSDWPDYPESLIAICKRLQGVVIENAPAREIIERNDGPEALFYLDPPYPIGLRTSLTSEREQYAHELTDAQHTSLLAFLQTLTGMVVLSGYPSALYDDALTDWRRVETAALADGARKRTEVLWINPAAAESLDRVKRGDSTPLFATEAL